MTDYNTIRRVLQSIRAGSKTVSGAFERLIQKELIITQGYREMASKSHIALREFLKKENERDCTFPVILSAADSDFIGGSYGRETKIWPLDDIDIYIPIDGYSLVYFDISGILPYEVITDNKISTNPINSSRWYEFNAISSNKLIQEFAVVLKRHYPDTVDVDPNGEAVSIRMKQGATKNEDGLGYDIVPCFLMRSKIPGNNEEFYLIPDGSDEWIRTNPRMDGLIADSLNKKNNGTYKKVIKMIKYWNKIKLNGMLSSYYIEYAVYGIYAQKNREGKILTKVSEGLARSFYELNRVIKIGNQNSIVKGAPPIEPGFSSQIGKLTALTRCSEASNSANLAWKLERNNNELEAINVWKEIFGDSFGE
ncbi:MAG: hypothetical protein ACOCUV_01635 [bacterium]